MESLKNGFFLLTGKVIFRDKNDFFRTKGLNYDKKPDHTSALVAFLVVLISIFEQY